MKRYRVQALCLLLAAGRGRTRGAAPRGGGGPRRPLTT